MVRVRVCLLIFVACTTFPLVANATIFDAGVFLTVSAVWEQMNPSQEPQEAFVPTDFEIPATLPSPDVITYSVLSEPDLNLVSIAMDYEQEMQTAAESSSIEKIYESQIDDQLGTAPVPEPSTILLLGIGLIGLAWFGRKRRTV